MLLLGSFGHFVLAAKISPASLSRRTPSAQAYLAFSCCSTGFTQLRGKTLKNLIEEHGGTVHMPPAKMASIFMSSAKRKKTELPKDLTHIVCEEKYEHAHGSKILADLDVPSIPDSVKVRIYLGNAKTVPIASTD